MRTIPFLLLFLFSFPNASPIVPGLLRCYSTVYSVGIEWDVAGDTNHNASCAVRYRKQGESALRDFVALFRVDFRGWDGADSADRAYNMVAGSVLFLEPATTYEIKLSLSDVDGGGKDTSLLIATRALPSLPTTGKTIHVTSGSGGGDGSQSNPYKGLAAAQSSASAGDIVLVHAGNYGNFSFSKSGATDSYIVWKSAGDGDAVLDFGRITGHHVWLYGIKFVNSAAQTFALVGQSGSTSNVITHCTFTKFTNNITLQANSNDWYIADNTIIGDKTDPRVTGDFEGEGIELEHTSGHTVCYNSISRVGDGVSYALRNCDIFGNDIFDVTDDGVEPDYGYANIRVWRNRITNPRNHGFSFQPMYCGPWYFIRNQIMGAGCYQLKYRVVDRFLLANNTFVGWNTLNIYDQNILSALCRNNLWIQAGGSGYIWEAMTCGDCTRPERWKPDWRTDIDYDGFDGGLSAPLFKWGNPVQRFNNLAEFVSATAIESHALSVSRSALFDSLTPLGPDSLYGRTHLTLRPSCAAIDKGAVLPGINQDFSGLAPDLGAYEYGKPLPSYGPRPEGNSPVAHMRPIAPETFPVIAATHGNRVVFRFGARDHGRVAIGIFDISGKHVASLSDEAEKGPVRTVVWSCPTPGFFVVTHHDAGGKHSFKLFLPR